MGETNCDICCAFILFNDFFNFMAYTYKSNGRMIINDEFRKDFEDSFSLCLKYSSSFFLERLSKIIHGIFKVRSRKANNTNTTFRDIL